MATQNQVTTRLVVDSSQYRNEMKQAQNIAQNLAKTNSQTVSNMGRDFANLARSIIGIGVAFQSVKKVVSEGIGFNRFVQEQTAAFSVMLKSVDDAKAKMAELYRFAVNSPLTFKETVAASKQLLAYGFSAESLVSNMKMLGTVAKATGHSLDDISYVYGTLRSQGRAYTRDLMQFAMRGIPIYDELAKVLKVDVTQIQKMTEAGKVGFAEVQKAFQNMTGEGGRFAGMMDKYMETLSGKLSMFTDVAQQAAGTLAGGITAALTDGMDSLIQTVKDAEPTLAVLGQMLGGLTTILMELVKVFIKLLPLVITFVAVFVTVKVIKLIAGLGQTIANLAVKMVEASLAITATTASLSTMGATMATVGTVFVQTLGMMGKALWAFATSPAGAAILGITAVIGGMGAALAKGAADRSALMQSDPAALLRKDIASELARRAKGAEYGYGSSLSYTVAQVKELSKEYNLSIMDTVSILQKLGVVTSDVVSAITNDVEALAESKALLAQKRAIERMPGYEREARYYAGVVGEMKPSAVYSDYVGKEGGTQYSLGVKAAKDYIAGFETQRAEMKAILKETYTTDDLKDALQQELDALREKLIEGASVLDYSQTKYDETLRKRIADILVLLDEGSAKAVETVKRDIWFEKEWRVKATKDKQDDLKLDYEKSIAQAQEKYQAEEITWQEYYNSMLSMETYYAAESLKLEQERLENLYAAYAGGDSVYFSNARQMAASNFEAGDTSGGLFQSILAGFEGTDIGKFIASTNKAATALISLGDAAAKTADAFITQLFDKIKGIDIAQSIDNITTGIANFVNKLFGWGDQAEDMTKKLGEEVNDLSDIFNKLKGRFDALIDRAEELINEQITSLQDLYEVGAISGGQYASDVDALWTRHAEELKAAYEEAGLEMPTDYATEKTLEGVYSALMAVAQELGVTGEELQTTQDQLAAAQADTGTTGVSDAAAGALAGAGIGAIIAGPIGAAVGGAIGAVGGFIGDLFGWWDVGSTNIPKDQMGTVHAGEAIIPKTFAEGIRSGEMVLSGKKNTSSGDTYVTVIVEGSVQTEQDLAASIAKQIHTQRVRGILTI